MAVNSVKKVVFFVDDNEQICSATEKLLARGQYAVKTFFTAEACYKSLSTERCDLLIVDMVLPGLDGIELIKKTRGIRPELLSIVITGFGSVPSAVRAIKAGATHFIEKPLNADNFLRTVDEVLEQKKHTVVFDKINKPISPAEKRILKRVLRGSSSKLIAEQLNLSVRTVEDHRSKIMLKLGVDNVVDLVKMTAMMDMDSNE